MNSTTIGYIRKSNRYYLIKYEKEVGTSNNINYTLLLLKTVFDVTKQNEFGSLTFCIIGISRLF